MLLNFLLSSIAFAALPFEPIDGDLVFHTSTSNQSQAIMLASDSPYSHMAVVQIKNGKPIVVEAIAKVSETPLEKWIARGKEGRVAVFRVDGLDAEKRKEVITGARKLLGRAYDIYFSSHNDTIYCSELAALAYRDAGIELGKWQKVKDLDMNNPASRELLKKRAAGHPLCKGRSLSAEKCLTLILDDELVTPDSIAKDPKLKLVFSSY